jgi:hypothetical protein
MHCGEQEALFPTFDPRFCCRDCATEWAYDYTTNYEAGFFFSTKEGAWYTRRADGEFAVEDGELVGRDPDDDEDYDEC